MSEAEEVKVKTVSGMSTVLRAKMQQEFTGVKMTVLSYSCDPKLKLPDGREIDALGMDFLNQIGGMVYR